MKKIAWLIALLSIGTVVGVGYFYWEKATSLPTWLTDEEPAPGVSPAAGQGEVVTSPPLSRPASAIQEKIKTAKPGQVREQLTAIEVDNLIVAGFNKGAATSLPKAVKKIKTQIKRDQIRTGAILDLAEIDSMPAGARQDLLKKLLQVMPQLKDKPIYIGIVGKLLVQNGLPQLSADSKLQIGQVELSLDEVAQRLGVSRTELSESAANYLQFSNVRLEKIDLTDQGAVITGQKSEVAK
jgi:hypothetical protein